MRLFLHFSVHCVCQLQCELFFVIQLVRITQCLKIDIKDLTKRISIFRQSTKKRLNGCVPLSLLLSDFVTLLCGKRSPSTSHDQKKRKEKKHKKKDQQVNSKSNRNEENDIVATTTQVILFTTIAIRNPSYLK